MVTMGARGSASPRRRQRVAGRRPSLNAGNVQCSRRLGVDFDYKSVVFFRLLNFSLVLFLFGPPAPSPPARPYFSRNPADARDFDRTDPAVRREKIGPPVRPLRDARGPAAASLRPAAAVPGSRHNKSSSPRSQTSSLLSDFAGPACHATGLCGSQWHQQGSSLSSRARLRRRRGRRAAGRTAATGSASSLCSHCG